jgi:hypothetical protein
MPDMLKIRVVKEMGNIFFSARKKIVHTKDFMAFVYKPVTQI